MDVNMKPFVSFGPTKIKPIDPKELSSCELPEVDRETSRAQHSMGFFRNLQGRRWMCDFAWNETSIQIRNVEWTTYLDQSRFSKNPQVWPTDFRSRLYWGMLGCGGTESTQWYAVIPVQWVERGTHGCWDEALQVEPRDCCIFWGTLLFPRLEHRVPSNASRLSSVNPLWRHAP